MLKCRNLTPEEATKRILQCVLPSHSDSQGRPSSVETVYIGLLISTGGDVVDGTRFLGGSALFRDSALQAVRKWKFKQIRRRAAGIRARTRISGTRPI